MNFNSQPITDLSPVFEIRKLDKLHTSYPDFIKRHLQRNYEIAFIMAGGGYHMIGGQRYLMKPGNVYSITPGDEHSLAITEPTVGYVLSFTENFLNTDKDDVECLPDPIMFTQLRNYPELELDKEAFDEIGDVLQLLLKEVSRYALLRVMIVRKLLRIVLYYLKQQMKHNMSFKHDDPCNQLVNNFFLLLENHFREHREVGYYGRKLFVTPNYLNHCIKKSTGFPARYHISQRIINEAKKKACHGEITLKQIAYMLGFEDACHFSRFFKKGTGYNFTQYKKCNPAIATGRF